MSLLLKSVLYDRGASYWVGQCYVVMLRGWLS